MYTVEIYAKATGNLLNEGRFSTWDKAVKWAEKQCKSYGNEADYRLFRT